MGYVALRAADEHHRKHPGKPSLALRALCGMLYREAKRDRHHFENFLKACAQPDTDNAHGAISRCGDLHSARRGIERALGLSLAMIDAASDALHEPLPHHVFARQSDLARLSDRDRSFYDFAAKMREKNA